MQNLMEIKKIKIISEIEKVNSLLDSGDWKLGKILEGKESIEFLMFYLPQEKEEEKIFVTYPFNTDYKDTRRKIDEFQKMVRELVHRELNVKK